ncbi:MAG: DLW-39 family protein [Nocardioidaceae bacterium]
MLKKLLVLAAAAAAAKIIIDKVNGQKNEADLWAEATDTVESRR